MEGAGRVASGLVGSPSVVTAGAGLLPVVVTVVATVVVVALLGAVVAVVRQARALRRAGEELVSETRALVDDLAALSQRAGADLDRVDDLVGSARRLTETVGTASHVAYAAAARPVIKVMALGAGTARATRRMRLRRRVRP
ncbi:MAG: hypothetical protein ACRDY0_07095 [Acidimicrobiales bacterium]